MEREADTVDALVSRGNTGELDDDAPLPTGAALGPYRVVRVLGEGGMGRVYLAVHDVIGRRVALKVLRRRQANDPRAVGRFFVEAQLVNRIRHPGIVEVTDLFVVSGMPCIVMELLEGTTFGAAIDDGALQLDDVLDVCAQIADALHAAHAAGVIHRDLKPDNVLLVPRTASMARGDERRRRFVAKVLDFGIAMLGGTDGGEAGGVMGTPEYMAPEQLTGQLVDARADVYALGVSLFHAATGSLPFSGIELRDLVHKQLHCAPPAPSDVGDVSADLEELILRMMAKSPANRPQTMADVARALRGLRERYALPPRAHAALGSAAMLLVATIGLSAWIGQAPHGHGDDSLPPDALVVTSSEVPPLARSGSSVSSSVSSASSVAPSVASVTSSAMSSATSSVASVRPIVAPAGKTAAPERPPRAAGARRAKKPSAESTSPPLALTSTRREGSPGLHQGATHVTENERRRRHVEKRQRSPLAAHKRGVIDPFAVEGR